VIIGLQNQLTFLSFLQNKDGPCEWKLHLLFFCQHSIPYDGGCFCL